MRRTLWMLLVGGCGFFKDGSLLDTGGPDTVVNTDAAQVVCGAGWIVPTTGVVGISTLTVNSLPITATYNAALDAGGQSPMCLKADGTGVEVILGDASGVWGTVHWEVVGPGDFGIGNPDAYLSVTRADGVVFGVWNAAQHAIADAGPNFAGQFTGSGSDGAGNFIDVGIAVTAIP